MEMILRKKEKLLSINIDSRAYKKLYYEAKSFTTNRQFHILRDINELYEATLQVTIVPLSLPPTLTSGSKATIIMV